MTGERDPIFGWSHNLYDVQAAVSETRQRLQDSYLNDIEGLEIPSLENVATWIWDRLDPVVPGLDRVLIRRGIEGAGEGCSYSGRDLRNAA